MEIESNGTYDLVTNGVQRVPISVNVIPSKIKIAYYSVGTSTSQGEIKSLRTMTKQNTGVAYAVTFISVSSGMDLRVYTSVGSGEQFVGDVITKNSYVYLYDEDQNFVLTMYVEKYNNGLIFNTDYYEFDLPYDL